MLRILSKRGGSRIRTIPRAQKVICQKLPVQGSYVGLDFGDIVAWDWREWVYNPANGHIVRQDDPTVLVPYNRLVLAVSRYEGP